MLRVGKKGERFPRNKSESAEVADCDVIRFNVWDLLQSSLAKICLWARCGSAVYGFVKFSGFDWTDGSFEVYTEIYIRVLCLNYPNCFYETLVGTYFILSDCIWNRNLLLQILMQHSLFTIFMSSNNLFYFLGKSAVIYLILIHILSTQSELNIIENNWYRPARERIHLKPWNSFIKFKNW